MQTGTKFRRHGSRRDSRPREIADGIKFCRMPIAGSPARSFLADGTRLCKCVTRLRCAREARFSRARARDLPLRRTFAVIYGHGGGFVSLDAGLRRISPTLAHTSIADLMQRARARARSSPRSPARVPSSATRRPRVHVVRRPARDSCCTHGIIKFLMLLRAGDRTKSEIFMTIPDDPRRSVCPSLRDVRQ